MFDILNSNSIGLKESESDFLSANEIQLRKDCVSCMEIGNEVALLQNSLILSGADKLNYPVDKLVKEAFKNKSWRKLLELGNPDDQDLCIQLTLHWYLSTPEGLRVWSRVKDSDKLSEKVLEGICSIIDRYATNFF